MKASMLKHLRVEAGMGNPPSEYINNDPKLANFMIKHVLHFSVQKPHKFIEKVEDIIESQQQNEDQAVFGKGPYHLRKDWCKNDYNGSHLTHVQLRKNLASYHAAGMSDKEEMTPKFDVMNDKQGILASPFQTVAESAEILNVPRSILNTIIS